MRVADAYAGIGAFFAFQPDMGRRFFTLENASKEAAYVQAAQGIYVYLGYVACKTHFQIRNGGKCRQLYSIWSVHISGIFSDYGVDIEIGGYLMRRIKLLIGDDDSSYVEALVRYFIASGQRFEIRSHPEVGLMPPGGEYDIGLMTVPFIRRYEDYGEAAP